jgi:hypothetical protein
MGKEGGGEGGLSKSNNNRSSYNNDRNEESNKKNVLPSQAVSFSFCADAGKAPEVSEIQSMLLLAVESQSKAENKRET